MSKDEEVFVVTEHLPTIKDHAFGDWLMRTFALACKREHRWKTHLNQQHGLYEYRNAVMLKRCVREAAAYEEQGQAYRDAVDRAGNILWQAMARHELAPGTYQQIMDILHSADLRR